VGGSGTTRAWAPDRRTKRFLPSGGARSIATVLCVTLICSDEDCAVEVEAWGELDEIEALVCDGCGCVLQVLSVAEAAPMPLVHLPRRVRLPRAA
jgi:hypothetical protein